MLKRVPPTLARVAFWIAGIPGQARDRRGPAMTIKGAGSSLTIIAIARKLITIISAKLRDAMHTPTNAQSRLS